MNTLAEAVLNLTSHQILEEGKLGKAAALVGIGLSTIGGGKLGAVGAEELHNKPALMQLADEKGITHDEWDKKSLGNEKTFQSATGLNNSAGDLAYFPDDIDNSYQKRSGGWVFDTDNSDVVAQRDKNDKVTKNASIAGGVTGLGAGIGAGLAASKLSKRGKGGKNPVTSASLSNRVADLKARKKRNGSAAGGVKVKIRTLGEQLEVIKNRIL